MKSTVEKEPGVLTRSLRSGCEAPASTTPQRSRLASLFRDRSGATGIEYGLIAMLIAVAMLVGLIALGGQVSTLYDDIATAYSDATS